MWAGMRCAPAGVAGRELLAGTSGSWVGGHGESPRRSRGDAAGAKLDADPGDRHVVNVGTARCRPRPARPARERAGASSADGTGWDGGPVVVAGVTTRRGGRESRPQGEGGQQVSSA